MSGKQLREIRKRLGWTQQQMAEKLGVWRNSVARWERDEMAISEPVARLIEILGKNKRRGK
ncbi:MAG: helix-turn-helix domain-containing protein [Candidatus Binataceae bacterium]|jgi:transcriptional regulator with XRE-family HTH domain